MKRFVRIDLMLAVFVVTAGCRSAGPYDGHEGGPGRSASPKENTAETVSAIKSVTEAISGRDLSDKELKKLGQEIRTDPEAQEAIQAITGAVRAGAPVTRYCPVCGRRYSPRLKICPVDKTPLKDIEE